MGVEERREQSETTPHKKARQEVAEAGGVGGGGGKPGEEGGFLSAMASKIGATMSGTNGRSGGEVISATMASEGEEGKMDGNGNGEPGEEGGFLSAMASKIGAAMSGANGGSGDGGGGNASVASGGEDKEADGNGGGGIFRKLLHSSPPAPPQASGKDRLFSGLRGQLDQEKFASLQCVLFIDRLIRVGAMETEEVKDQGVAGEQAGILSAMATKIGMAMSGANGVDSHGGSGDDAKTSNGEAARGDNGEEKKGEEANGGGILSAVASKIGVAVSGANNGNGNHSANGNGNHSAEDDAKTSTGDDGHGSKGEEKGRDVNGGRIVEQIISNLPSGI